MRWIKVIPALTTMLVATVTQAETLAPITGIFSDLYYNDEGGDLLGTEIIIVPDGKHGYAAMVQIAEGEPETPVLVPIHIGESNKITFTVHSRSGNEIYSGVANRNSFDGKRTLEGKAVSETLHLKRGRSYWETKKHA